jgi:hypothetical protein
VERENDYALVISLDSVNSSAFVEAYTPIPSSDSSSLSHIYLSTCDYPDTPSSTLYTTICTPANSTTSPLTTSPSDRLAPYTDLFLSAKKKYKPVAKRSVQLLENYPRSSASSAKLSAIHSTTYQHLTRTLHHSHPPTATPSSDKINLTRTILATSCGQRRET